MTVSDKDMRLLLKALEVAKQSRDPNTKVGAVLTRDKWEVAGYNQLPIGIPDPHGVMANRDKKLQAIIHGEMDVLCSAARIGISTKGGQLYIACTDDTDEVWGGCPCTNCAKHVIQAGIKRVVTFKRKSGFSKWHTELELAEDWLTRAGIEVTYVPYTE